MNMNVHVSLQDLAFNYLGYVPEAQILNQCPVNTVMPGRGAVLP